MPTLEDFNRGIPLNATLARMAAGDAPPSPVLPEGFQQRSQPEIRNLFRDLTNDEREDLKRLTFEPGWAVLQRLKLKALRLKEHSATLQSQLDPLKNRDTIAETWAYMAIWKRLITELDAMVDLEISLIQKPDMSGPAGEQTDESILA